MKLMFIIGPGAVGKMTVGQELCKITSFKLMHNHQMIEPVLNIFGECNFETVLKLRDVIFDEFAQTDNYGLIYTLFVDFDFMPELEHIQHVIDIFNKYQNTEVYCVELNADLETRLIRNNTNNRIKCKPSKQDIHKSIELIYDEELHTRYISNEDEHFCNNWLIVDNTNLTAREVALKIKDSFNL